MSYSVWLEIDTGGPDKAQVGADNLNYTSNCAQMWTTAGVWFRVLDGLPASTVALFLEHGIDEMKRERGRYKAMEPDNGWGDYSGALGFLESVLRECRYHPKATLVVSS